jgi:hypothetical protein
MVAQFVYTVVTILPAILLFYDHELANVRADTRNRRSGPDAAAGDLPSRLVRRGSVRVSVPATRVSDELYSLNGANFYLGKPFRPIQLDYKLKATAEVFGRRFEKELHKLQKELDELQVRPCTPADATAPRRASRPTTRRLPRRAASRSAEPTRRTRSRGSTATTTSRASRGRSPIRCRCHRVRRRTS